MPAGAGGDPKIDDAFDKWDHCIRSGLRDAAIYRMAGWLLRVTEVTTPMPYCIAFPYVGTPCCTRKSSVCPRDDQSLCGYLEINCWASEMARFFDWSDFFGCSSVL